jgi:LacI family transcriptional regulator
MSGLGSIATMFKSPRIILLIAPARAFDRGLLQGIARYANEYGPWTFYREPPHYQVVDWKKKVTDRLRSGQVDAIIMREPERIDEIIQFGIPGICAPVTKAWVEGFINVTIDNEAVGRLGAEHLIQCGFRHFAYCGFRGIYWSGKRGEAFECSVRQAATRATPISPRSPGGSTGCGRRRSRCWSSGSSPCPSR